MPRRPSFESGPSWRFSSEEGARRYCAMSLPLILIGAVTRAQGLKGALRVVPYLGAMEDYEGLRSVTLVTEGGREERKVRACRPHGKVLIVELEGLDDRDAAEACVGASLYADRSQLPDLEEGDDVYVHGSGVVGGFFVEVLGRDDGDGPGFRIDRDDGLADERDEVLLAVACDHQDVVAPGVDEAGHGPERRSLLGHDGGIQQVLLVKLTLFEVG